MSKDDDTENEELAIPSSSNPEELLEYALKIKSKIIENHVKKANSYFNDTEEMEKVFSGLKDIETASIQLMNIKIKKEKLLQEKENSSNSDASIIAKLLQNPNVSKIQLSVTNTERPVATMPDDIKRTYVEGELSPVSNTPLQYADIVNKEK